jgi:hypothetical protein
MPLVSGSIPNLVNGVSQQPPTYRLSSQAEVKENAFDSVAEGMIKRQPRNHRARVLTTSDSNAFGHVIYRDQSEQYQLVIRDGEITVWDLLANEAKTVNAPDGLGYVTGITPKDDLSAMTVADYTFIVNGTVAPQMQSDTSPVRQPEALIHVRQGNYGKTYSININGGQYASYTTPDGGSASDARDIDTSHIAGKLESDLNSNLGSSWTVTRYGRVIHLQNDSDFTVSCQDGFNGNAMYPIKDSVQDFQDLPTRGPDGFHIKVIGSPGNSADDYYVEFDGSGSGVWTETLGQGVKYKIDPSTMPHVLVREQDGTFTFRQADWADRQVGDENSSPTPGFIGKTLNDVFFHRNRLGFLADESVILSRAGEYFDFWPGSVITLLDTDPIDIASSHTKVSILQSAVPFNERLLVFSSNTQFVLEGGEVLSPKNAALPPATEFEADAHVRPVSSGQNIYFPVSGGAQNAHARIMEFYTEQNVAASQNARDVTSHVQQYIPAPAYKLAVTSLQQLLVVVSESERNAIYVYKYFWEGRQKLQSSWSKWTFDDAAEVIDLGFIQSRLWLTINRPDGIYVEWMDLEPGITDPDVNAGYLTRLDRRLNENQMASITYDSGSDETTFTTPDLVWQTEPEVVTRDTDQETPSGVKVQVNSWSGKDVTVDGDWRGVDLYFGEPYTKVHEFSTIYMKEGSGENSQAIQSGRLQLRKMSTFHNETGYYRVEVTPQNRPTYTYEFTGLVLGTSSATLGQLSQDTGSFEFPIQSKNDRVRIRIVNDTFQPSAILSAEWEGFWVHHSRRVG